jgi:Fur family ferric uptake transcriptional regulator
MSCEKIFLDRLREQGLRLTPQREMVLSVMHQLKDMATAEEILERVRRQSAAVDVSTIYRTLDLLQGLDLVISVDSGAGHRLYKLVGIEGPHLHLVCGQCGKVMGVDLSPAQSLATYLQDQHGFEMDMEHLSLPGLCCDCIQKSESSPRTGT